MFDLLIVFFFVWLFLKTIRLAFKVAWGTAKIAASILFTIAVPMLIGCILLSGGILLLLPIMFLAAAFGLLKASV